MSDRREIFRGKGAGYEVCDIVYWPTDRKVPDYLIAMDSRGHEFICHQAYGTWAEMSLSDIIGRFRHHDRSVDDTRRHFAQPNRT